MDKLFQFAEDKTKPKMRPYCPRCKYPLTTCLCNAVQTLQSPVSIVILQHVKEIGHAKNTARLVKLCMEKCWLVNTGDSEAVEQLKKRLAHSRSALIYPSETSKEMEARTSDFVSAHYETLVFLDGSWRQAFALFKSYPWLAQLPQWHFASPPPNQYHIRHTDKTASVSTLEAVAYSLEVGYHFNGEPLRKVQAALLAHWQGPETHRRQH